MRKTIGVCVTIGGGQTALECARTALHPGARQSVVAYGRIKQEMPAGSSELMKAVEEGVEFLWRVSPVRLRGKKTVKTVEFVLNQMVPSGKGGRKGFKEIAGTEFSFPVNTVILALGKERDLEVPSRHEGEKLHRTPKPYNLERVNSSRVGTG